MMGLAERNRHQKYLRRATPLVSVPLHPLDALEFPVWCRYPGCGDGPFNDGLAVDEHITELHLSEAVWTFALDQMGKPVAQSLPVEAPEGVIHKARLCPVCHCGQTLPVMLQKCACACHPNDRLAAVEAPEDQEGK